MGLAAWLLLTAACREINPDYDGPVASSSATETAGTESEPEPTAGSSGATADDAAASGSSGAPPSTSSGEPGSSSDAPGDEGEDCMGMICAGECVDVQTDDDHCGMCNRKCNGQKECIAGECQNP